MATFGQKRILSLLICYGSMWLKVTAYGSIWPMCVYAALYGSMWLQMALYGYNLSVLLLMAQDGSRLPRRIKMTKCLHMAQYGYVQDGSRLPQMAQDSYMAPVCFILLLKALMATCGTPLPQMAQDDFIRL